MIKCYRDSKGMRRVDANDVHPLIGPYLEQDIQNSWRGCDCLLQVIEDMSSGKQEEWKGTGNAHTLTIRDNKVTIENDWDDSMGTANISLSVFRECVLAWREFVTEEEKGPGLLNKET